MDSAVMTELEPRETCPVDVGDLNVACGWLLEADNGSGQGT